MEKLIDRPWYRFYPEIMNNSQSLPECSVYQLLHDSEKKYGNKVALRFQDQRISYRELKDTVDRLASSWHDMGIKKGERIGLMLLNQPMYVYAYYAAQKLGATVVQINPMYMPREIEEISHEVGLSYLVTESRYMEKLETVMKSYSFDQLFLTDQNSSVLLPNTHFIERLIKEKAPDQKAVPIKAKDDIAVIQFTGGTTGKMKGAMLTHYNLVSNVIQSYLMYGSEMKLGEEVTLTATPLYHVYAMTSGMNLSIYIGATNIIVPKFDVNDVLRIIRENQPSFFPGVPTMYNAFVNHPDVKEYGLNCFKFCSSGSAPLPIEVINRFEEITGAVIGEGFGMSETSPSTHRNPPFGERKIGSIGIPFPGTDCQIVDEDGNELPPKSVGELAIKGPQVMKGYWNKPEETSESIKNGWLLTGDLATMDKDGYFYIVGRKKEMIITGGFNVYPQEIESVLYEHPSVKEAAVIGIPHEYSGERVKAFVVVKDHSISEEELLAHCYENLTRYKVPKQIEIRDSLPRNTVGKLLKRLLITEETIETGR
ncbi:long-chain fatty acid--CoA ligase [Bacillus sp. Cs-700]|uniref:long-chain-fatty-acid--CoA ligase n=1 Tax=Bacillus sp. Cs-700 TaxID=2589818 RepID=UPI001F611880|nr:long-chain fatty acid--CoA ligase [Bacillus sp. Cs-700]